MRYLIALLVATALALAVAGCAKKAELTQAKKVENPPDAAAPAAPTASKPKVAAKPEAKPTPGPNKWTKTASGLKYRDKMIGTGPAVKVGDVVSVLYKGWLDNGTVFDASARHGNEPFSFVIGQGGVIKGWDEGVQGMKTGGVRELVIPPSLGYGDEDQGTIPPNSTLHFTVQLLQIGG